VSNNNLLISQIGVVITLNVLQGLTTAFIYNAGMYGISIQSDIEIIYPLLIAAPQIIVYTTLLLHVGVSKALKRFSTYTTQLNSSCI